MVPPIAIRSLWPAETRLKRGYGALSAKAPGVTGDDTPKQQPAFCDPAAFFDALIAQQDRHDTNYRWETGRLGLLDNAYAFATPDPDAYLPWASVFVQARHDAGRSALTANELHHLAELEATTGLWQFLDRILQSDQAGALRDRIKRMTAGRQLLQPLEF